MKKRIKNVLVTLQIYTNLYHAIFLNDKKIFIMPLSLVSIFLKEGWEASVSLEHSWININKDKIKETVTNKWNFFVEVGLFVKFNKYLMLINNYIISEYTLISINLLPICSNKISYYYLLAWLRTPNIGNNENNVLACQQIFLIMTDDKRIP